MINELRGEVNEVNERRIEWDKSVWAPYAYRAFSPYLYLNTFSIDSEPQARTTGYAKR